MNLMDLVDAYDAAQPLDRLVSRAHWEGTWELFAAYTDRTEATREAQREMLHGLDSPGIVRADLHGQAQSVSGPAVRLVYLEVDERLLTQEQRQQLLILGVPDRLQMAGVETESIGAVYWLLYVEADPA